eukprot:12826.XXX_802949_803125_1 [CDS] Oithona nana genome sequencing.
MIFSAYNVAILLIIILELSKFALTSSSDVLSHLKDLGGSIFLKKFEKWNKPLFILRIF